MNHSSDIERNTVGENEDNSTSFTRLYKEGKKKLDVPKTDDEFWKEILLYYPHTKGAKPVYDAFKADGNAHLFILVIKEEKKRYDMIYVFKKEKTTIEDKLNRETINTEILPNWLELKMDINDESKVIKKGKLFKEHLLRKLPNPLIKDITGDIWIYCEDEDIEPLWEWLYMDNIGFLADKTLLIRVPRECEFNRKVNRDEDESAKTSKFAVLSEINCPQADDAYTLIKSICENYSCDIDIGDQEGLEKIISYNYIHASLTKVDEDSYKPILDAAKGNISGQKKLPCFLFLKMCGCSDGIRAGVFGLVNPDVWIETSFEVGEVSFEEEFYRVFCNTGDISKAIIKARNEISNSFLRFAYVLKGNPLILREFLKHYP